MQPTRFRGRCFKNPLLPCICPLEEGAQITDATAGINPTTHGEVVDDLISPDPKRNEEGQETLRKWKTIKESVSGRPTIIDRFCPRQELR